MTDNCHDYNLDLVVMVPGKDEEKTVEALLTARQGSLGIKEIKFKIFVHPGRDPGCYKKADSLLREFVNKAEYCLVIFDHEGSGQEKKSPEKVSADLRERLSRNGWQDRAEVLVISPELEAWVWSESPEVDRMDGAINHRPSVSG